MTTGTDQAIGIEGFYARMFRALHDAAHVGEYIQLTVFGASALVQLECFARAIGVPIVRETFEIDRRSISVAWLNLPPSNSGITVHIEAP